ncbi:hypothetical protein Tco_0895564 [Tanacetum coccineum]|uniref:Uncharacterized protein n=1 Tax=Tanacetum coccineum TaxID=301880 RepID=A0ABQ5CGG8_9ASTR
MLTLVKQGRSCATTAKAQENGVALDEEQRLFLAGGQDNAVDEDVDEPPMMFMANLSSTDPVYDEASQSYDSDVVSKVHDNDHYQDAICENHEVHEMHDDVQPNYVVNSHADYTNDSNMIPYAQYERITWYQLYKLLFPNLRKNVKKRIYPTGLTEGDSYISCAIDLEVTRPGPLFRCHPIWGCYSIQTALTKEVKEMKEIFEELEDEVEQNAIFRKHDEIEWKNLLIANDNLIVECLSKDVFYVATNSELNVSRLTEMHEAHTIVQTRCLELETELSKLHDKVQKDDYAELVKCFSNLEVNHFNLQLKYQNLKERFGNNTSPSARDISDLDSGFVIEKLKASIQGKDNTIQILRMQLS